MLCQDITCLTGSVLCSGWSCNLEDVLILVVLLPVRMVKHLSALNCMSQVVSQEPTELR